MNRKIVTQIIPKTTPLNSNNMVSHYVKGELIEEIYGLQIVCYADDAGYYLLYLDKNGKEITDTYHETIESAIEQADLEFNLTDNLWI
jgi:hypothetical protein